jgi:hypothetical protein
MGAWRWQTADGVESMPCGFGRFIPLKILSAVGALSFMMRSPIRAQVGEGCIAIRTAISRFMFGHLSSLLSCPPLRLSELLSIVAPDHLRHLPALLGSPELPRLPDGAL